MAFNFGGFEGKLEEFFNSAQAQVWFKWGLLFSGGEVVGWLCTVYPLVFLIAALPPVFVILMFYLRYKGEIKPQGASKPVVSSAAPEKKYKNLPASKIIDSTHTTSKMVKVEEKPVVSRALHEQTGKPLF